MVNNFGNQKMYACAKSSEYGRVGLRWTVVNITPFITNEDSYFPIKQKPLQIKK